MQKNRRELRALIALSLIPGLGNHRIKQLISFFEDPEEIFNTSKVKLQCVEGIGTASSLSILTFKKWEEVDRLIDHTKNIGADLLGITDPGYPSLLKQIYDPPALLWIKGNTSVLNDRSIGVIGTRNPSEYGKRIAKKLTNETGESGLTIISGLAYGIDTIAHRTAVQHDIKTVAVLGSGIDRLYPESNGKLAKQIIKQGGAVITEFAPGTPPDAGNFPVRNRVVSGLTSGVIVIESGLQGGSMITASIALDQNREVFAVPHSLDNLSGAGNNYLIKTGAAKLVQSLDDILVELPFFDMRSGTNTNDKPRAVSVKKNWREQLTDDKILISICELLEESSVQIDHLGEKLEMDTGMLLSHLLTLEMKGLVKQSAGKVFSLI